MKQAISFLILAALSFASLFSQINTKSGTTVNMKSGTCLVLGGNYLNYGTLNASSGSSISFKGFGTQTVTELIGNSFSNMIVDKSSGAVSLTSDVTVNGTLTLTTGNISTGINTLSLGSSASLAGEQTGRYVIGHLQTTVGVGNGQSTTFNGVGVTLASAAEDLGNVTLTRISGSAVSLNGFSSINRRWILRPQNALAVARDLTLSWITDDDNGKTLLALQGWQSSDNFVTTANCSAIGNVMDGSSRSLVLTLHALTASNDVSFSFTQVGEPLPVESTPLRAEVKDIHVTLSWETSTEVNNNGFTIERSANGADYASIGFVHGHGTSNTPNSYQFVDTPNGGFTFRYRMKQIDNDGKFTYSAPIEVVLEVPKQYALHSNYPNPFNPSTTNRYDLPQDGVVTIKVFDAVGREMQTLVNGYQVIGFHELTFDADKLSSGMYLYTFRAGDFFAVKKMLLLR